MKKIAITSQMGSGKTYVCSKFKNLGIPVLIMDEVVKYLHINDQDMKSEIMIRFPNSFVDGKMDKQKFANELFFDKSRKNLKDLSKIIHPYLFREVNKFYESNKDKQFCLVETALLYEYELEKDFDEVIFIKSDADLRKKKAIERDGISSQEYDLRMKDQISDEIKESKSNFIINNDYTDNVLIDINRVYSEICLS